MEYVCRSYHRGGKAICSSHRVHEETIDASVRENLEALHSRRTEEQADLRRLQLRTPPGEITSTGEIEQRFRLN